MSDMILIILAWIVSALAAFLLSPVSRQLAESVDAIDRPADGRRMHKKPIPRLGGISIFIGLFIALIVFVKPDRQALTIIAGGIAILLAGIADDIFNLHYLIKLAVQTAAALLVISSGVTVGSLRLLFSGNTATGVFAIPITLIFIVGMTNAVNMIDGLDGLSCGTCVLSSLSLSCIAFLCGNTGAAASFIAISGACFGFLPYNTYPAEIFMGDTGSMMLGFMLSSFSVKYMFPDSRIPAISILLIFAFPVADLIFAVVRRVMSGKNPLKADSGHIHHILISKGTPHGKAVCMLYVISGIMSAVGMIIFGFLYK